MTSLLENFTDVLGGPNEICDSQPLSLSFVEDSEHRSYTIGKIAGDSASLLGSQPNIRTKPVKGTGQHGEFRSVDEIDEKYKSVFSYPFFNLVQSRVIEDALYSDKSMVVCAPTGSGKTVVFEMAIVHLLMELEDRCENNDFKIIYMAPVKALCTERLTEWYPKFTKLGLLCIEVTGDTDVDFSQLQPYRIIITTPEKWDMLTRRWRDHRQLVEVIKLFLIDEVHILNDETRGPVLEAVVSRMKTIATSVQSTHRIEQLQQQYQGTAITSRISPSIRFVAVSATVSNPEDVADWLGTADKPAVYYKFGDECRPVKLKRVVEGYPCAEGSSIFKFDLVLNYKLWPIIQKYHNGKPTLIFCNTRKSVAMTAETLSREITISFNEEQKARLTAVASTIKNKKLQLLVLSGVGCHHAGLLYEERVNIEQAFRNRDLPILITTTTLAMGVNLPAHLVIIKNTQQYVSGAYQEYSISTILQMVGRAGRPQFDTEATAVIMTRHTDKPRYQALVGGSEPLQSYLHKRLPENLNSEAALGTVSDVAQCVQWLRSTFLSVRAAKDPKRYLGLSQTAPHHQISKKIEELCVKAMNGLASAGLITMDEACCIESTEAGRLMSIFYLDLETMKHIMKIDGTESLQRLLWIVCESHELSDMHLRMDERRCLNALNRNNTASTIRFPMKGKITTRQMKLNCVIQAVLGCLPIPDPSLNQEATKIMRIADRVCKCLVAYVTRPALVNQQPMYYSAILNTILLAKCVAANLWENSPFVSKQLKGIGPTFSTLLATAGKVNFMLLEESHPRDLERIMNKGPPAGNILRKQVSLFPKYQINMTPIDEKNVSIQLVLLNHHNLSQNMDQLTAGSAHKSYVIIGDSENILLLFKSFSDKDLIGLYDGRLTYQITRKHGFEHKIYAHCVSSVFAGIDAQCEYVFKNVDSLVYPSQTTFSNDIVNKPTQKQTTITDTFRERKRKNTDNKIPQCKEKKKRESALFEKFKNLKESFGQTLKVLKDDVDKSAVVPQRILQELTHLENPYISRSVPNESTFTKQNYDEFKEQTTYEINDNDFVNDEFMDEDKINDILNEIECEISKGCKIIKDEDKTKSNATNNSNCIIQKVVMPIESAPIRNSYSEIESYKAMNNRKRINKTFPKKSNYNFIDLLERNVDLSDAEETTVHEPNSFTDAIRSHIEKYLQKTKTNIKSPDRTLELIQNEPVLLKETEPIVILPQDSNVIDKDGIDAHGDMQRTSDSNLEVLAKVDVKDTLTVDDTSKQVSQSDNKIQSIDLEIDELPSIEVSTQQNNNNIVIPVVFQNCLNQNLKEKEKLTEILPKTKGTGFIPPFKLPISSNNDKTTSAQSGRNNNISIDRSSAMASKKQNFLELGKSCVNQNKQLTTHTFLCSTLKGQLTSTKQNNTNKEAEELSNDGCVPEIQDKQKLLPIAQPKNSTVSFGKTTDAFPHSPASTQLYHSNYKVPLVLPSMMNFTSIQLNENPKLFEIDLPNIHKKVVAKYNNPTASIIENQQAFSQQDNYSQFINKYSFSSCKTDVSTQENADHVVRVIKKLRIDLDITKIISENKNGNRTKGDMKEQTDNTDDNPNVSFKKSKPASIPMDEQCSEQPNVIVASCSTDLKNDTKPQEKFIANSNNLVVIQNLPFPSTEPFTKLSSFSKEKREEVIKEFVQFDKVDRDSEDNKNTYSNYKIKGTLINKPNNITSILQKYSNIMRNNTRNADLSLTQNKADTDSNIAKKDKPKRPFKISDINRLNPIPLPCALIQNTKPVNVTECFNLLEPNGKHAQLEQNKQQNISNLTISTSEERIIEKEYSENMHEIIQNNFVTHDISYNDPITCIAVHDVKETVANIDQTMFDPKALLQCFSKDEPENIVPPPPAFSDLNTISDTTSDLTVPMDCYEPTGWEEDASCEKNYNRSIFQDNSQIELTPSKEIETWNLSQDERGCKIYASPGSSPHSFTIMRKTTEPRINILDKSLLQNSLPRHNLLKQFKFNHKSKFKP